MSKLIMVTGGARSGKSAFAEKLAADCGMDILYIATSIPFDNEMKLRIKKHREQRPSYWETLEAYRDLDKHLEERTAGRSAILLDCITIMVTNLMFEQEMDWDNLKAENIENMEARVQAEMNKLVAAAKNTAVPFILVTNEIGMGIVPDNPMSRIFRDIAGRANQMLAKASDEVYLCVSGIPVKIK